MADDKLEGDFVLDTSVLIKWFCVEELTETALEFRQRYAEGNVEIVVPDLVLYEIANALRYNKILAEDDVKMAVYSVIQLGIDIIVPTKNILNAAISFAFNLGVTVYDAYFLALAKELNFVCVTADERFYVSKIYHRSI